VTRIAGVSGTTSAPRRVTRGPGGFALPDGAGETPQAQGTAGVAPVLLALQEDGARRSRGRRSAAWASLALEELQGLQLDLLRSGPDPARLERLAALADSAGAAEPALAGLLEDVALRARVELARYRAARRGHD
jgi:hypothetical protein